MAVALVAGAPACGGDDELVGLDRVRRPEWRLDLNIMPAIVALHRFIVGAFTAGALKG